MLSSLSKPFNSINCVYLSRNWTIDTPHPPIAAVKRLFNLDPSHVYNWSMFQNYLTFLVFALLFIWAKLLTAKPPESILSGNEFENIQYGETKPVSFGLCTQFVTSMLSHHGKRKGPVCRNKLVLIYLCSLLLPESYAPEPNPGPRPGKYPCGYCKKGSGMDNTGNVYISHCEMSHGSAHLVVCQLFHRLSLISLYLKHQILLTR